MTGKKDAPGNSTAPGMPVWVKVFFIIIIVLVMIVVLAHLTGLRFDHGGGATLFNGPANYTYLLENEVIHV